MNIKPILFSTAMVQALQNGSKTQTRRVVKPQPRHVFSDFLDGGIIVDDGTKTNSEIYCPYGKVGDILWVRETWAETTNVNQSENWLVNRAHLPIGERDEGILWNAIIYHADGEWQWCDDDGFSTEKSYWKPSIFMPKAACRIFLKITGVRVERLQSISESDAIAEGVEKYHGTDFYKMYGGKKENDWCATAYASYAYLWQSINGPESWDANPWVWVVTFERCEKPEGFL